MNERDALLYVIAEDLAQVVKILNLWAESRLCNRCNVQTMGTGLCEEHKRQWGERAG